MGIWLVMSENRICICICICVIERVPSMGICRLWQPVRRRDGRTCPACPMASIAQYAQYSRACPTASSIACSSQRQCLPDQAYRCTGILAYRHTGKTGTLVYWQDRGMHSHWPRVRMAMQSHLRPSGCQTPPDTLLSLAQLEDAAVF